MILNQLPAWLDSTMSTTWLLISCLIGRRATLWTTWILISSLIGYQPPCQPHDSWSALLLASPLPWLSVLKEHEKKHIVSLSGINAVETKGNHKKTHAFKTNRWLAFHLAGCCAARYKRLIRFPGGEGEMRDSQEPTSQAVLYDESLH